MLNALAKDLAGDISSPSSPDFPDQQKVFYDEYGRRRPLALARPVDAEDVGKVVRFAADSDVPLAVRAGGHSVMGHSNPAEALVVDLSRLDDLEIDVEGRTAWAGGGVLAGAYTNAAGAHGLATGFGDTATVGVAGLTLGGGIGFLHRKFGLTIDSLLAAEMVTPDGEVRLVDESNDPDLFWAIRGGGGNFGVVTRLQYRLHPVDTVTGGMLILPASPESLVSFVEAAVEAPDYLSVIVAVAVAPPMPFLPPEVHGQLVMMGVMVHSGPQDQAESDLARFRSIATPLVDGLETMSYPDVFAGPEPPQPVAMSVRSVFADEFSPDEAGAALDALSNATADMNIIQIRALGGAVSRVPNDATAFGHRQRAMTLNVAAAYEAPESRPEHEKWVEAVSEELRDGDPGAYINFLGDDSPEAVRAAYPQDTWERLVEVKTKYDPSNLFAFNHNIPPRA